MISEFVKLKKLIGFSVVLWLSVVCHCDAQIETSDPNDIDGEVNAQSVDEARTRLIDGILERLIGEDRGSSIEAGLALSEIATVDDVPQLIEALKRGNHVEAQVTLIEILGHLHDTRAAKQLRFEIEHGKAEAKIAAVRALGYIRHVYVVPVLLQVLKGNGDLRLRLAAASALGQLKMSDATYALNSAISGNYELPPSVRRAVEWALLVAQDKITSEAIDLQVGYGSKSEFYFKGTRYHFYTPSYRPKKVKPRLLVCIHDQDLDATQLFAKCAGMAKGAGLAVLVPYFDNIRFPDYFDFNYRGERADKRLLELIAHVATDADIEAREFYLYGAGAGGNFVQRFVFAYSDRIARAAFYTKELMLPDPELYFPEGLRRNLRAPDLDFSIDKFIKTDVAILMEANKASNRLSYRLYDELDVYATAHGITSRLARRNADGVEQAFTVGVEYLNRKN